MLHVLVAEKALGKSLARKHPVHHVDENPSNNDASNLVICESAGYHRLLHLRMEVQKAGFNPNTHKKCGMCKKFLALTEFYITARKGAYGGKTHRCKDCIKIVNARRYAGGIMEASL